MSLPPYPGPDGDSGDESTDVPETPPPSEPYGDQPAPPPAYGQQPPPPPGYGQQPPAYGQPSAYGQQPPAYGYGAYSGANEAGRSWSGTAIAAFVTSLFCCGLPSVILGIIGLLRTGEGKGKGRWMAVTGLVLGVVGIAVQVAAVVGGLWFLSSVVAPEDAEVGMCVTTDYDDEETSVLIREVDCSDDHDAEIFHVQELSSTDISSLDAAGPAALCANGARGSLSGATNPRVVDGKQVVTLNGVDVRIDAVTEDPDDLQPGDHIACYVEAVSGDLDEQLLD